MTISEKAKFAAAKRHIKREYARQMKFAKDAEGNDAKSNFHLGYAAAYFDCFRQFFYPDGNMTNEMLHNLITIQGNGDD